MNQPIFPPIQLPLFQKIEFGADFSEDKLYRYALWRKWDLNGKFINFLMLNPSTADDIHNDPTVERCQRRAVQLGYGGLYVTNLFAYRSTDKSKLKRVIDPVGKSNDATIIDVAEKCDRVVCAWGTDGNFLNRGTAVFWMLRSAGITTYALKLTKSGHPSHPLYLAYDLQPQPFRMA